MLVQNVTNCFHFDDQLSRDEKVREIIAEQSSVFVEHRNGRLLRNLNPCLSQAMCEGVLIHFFQMSMPMIAMNGIPSFPHDVAKRKDVHSSSFVPFAPLCGNRSLGGITPSRIS